MDAALVPAENSALVEDSLTQAEDTFCLAMIECGGNIGAAYRLTFGENSPYPIARGKELLSLPRVALRIKAITDKIADACVITRYAHLNELAIIRDTARGTGQLKVALAAEVKRGEVGGFYKDTGAGGPHTAIQINFVSKFDDRI